MLSIANYNMHCGMDGWGRPYDYVAAIAALDADVIVLEEAWTVAGDEGGGQSAEVSRDLGYQIVAHTLGEGRRIRPQPATTDSWLTRPIWKLENKALYMDGVRPVSARVKEMPRWQEAEQGTWGIAILVRPELEDRGDAGAADADVAYRPRDAGGRGGGRDGVGAADLGGGHPHVASAHGLVPQLGGAAPGAADLARPDAVLAGDMNTWGPLVNRFMPGWRRAVIGPTWPSWRPHSQIDHILVRGSGLRPVAGVVFPHSGSDHRPVRAEFDVG